jgi:hypothetical protein
LSYLAIPRTSRNAAARRRPLRTTGDPGGQAEIAVAGTAGRHSRCHWFCSQQPDSPTSARRGSGTPPAAPAGCRHRPRRAGRVLQAWRQQRPPVAQSPRVNRGQRYVERDAVLVQEREAAVVVGRVVVRRIWVAGVVVLESRLAVVCEQVGIVAQVAADGGECAGRSDEPNGPVVGSALASKLSRDCPSVS